MPLTLDFKSAILNAVWEEILIASNKNIQKVIFLKFCNVNKLLKSEKDKNSWFWKKRKLKTLS